MIITINLMELLQFYLIGSVVSILIVHFHKETRKCLSNYIIGFFMSWATTLLCYWSIVIFILKHSKNHLSIYNYCILYSILNFRFSRYKFLRAYCNLAFKKKYASISYEKPYFANKKPYYDIYGSYQDLYYDMVESRFCRIYDNRSVKLWKK